VHKNEIAKEVVALRARYLQQQIWNERATLCDLGVVPEDPVDLLEPGLGFRILGFTVATDDLGEIFDNGRRVRAAGSIDWRARQVTISPNFSRIEQLFTAAHELGHAILHPGLKLHRDKVVSGPSPRRDFKEMEADHFAACFLMPERLLRRRLLDSFAFQRFELDDQTAYALCQKNAYEVKAIYRTKRDLSMAIATAVSYNGRNFRSLATYFCVSPTTMAIRLEELELV
jgi:hypothetical protein